MCYFRTKLKCYEKNAIFEVCLSFQVLFLLPTGCEESKLIKFFSLTSSTRVSHWLLSKLNQLMSLWAWITYTSLYISSALKVPFSLTIWQHFYNLNVLLVVQETADTFGFVCLTVLFLSAQLLSRNFMFSIFLTTASPSLDADDSSKATRSPSTANSVKSLTKLSTTFSSFKSLLSYTSVKIKSKLIK